MKLYTMFRSLLYHKYVREIQVQDVLYLHCAQSVLLPAVGYALLFLGSRVPSLAVSFLLMSFRDVVVTFGSTE